MAKGPNLLRKVKIDRAWLMLPVVRHKVVGGEQRFDLTRVTFQGAPIVVTSGTFYLEYYEDGGRKRRAIGDHPTTVKAALATQASVLGLRAQGVAADDAPQLRPRPKGIPEGKTVKAAVQAFVDSPPIEYQPTTYLKYRNALECFRDWSKKRYVGEIEREDVRGFLSSQVKDFGLDPSTAIDKARAVVKILRDAGAPIAMKKGDWPKVTERQREVYQPHVLKRLFAAANKEEYVLFQTFLLSGMRDMEVCYLHWSDFNRRQSTLTVSKKTGFNPKNYQERTIPIPSQLVVLLEQHRDRQGTAHGLIFPTSTRNTQRGAPGGQPDYHLLRRLKKLALRAGLNCGQCIGVLYNKPSTCSTQATCGQFGLHMFRHTYATTLLRDGVDLLSLQKLLGHKDLDSTRKYLRALEPDDLLKKINLTSLATRFV